MDPELFDQTLRKFVRKVPFETFLVELLNGQIIEITHPNVAFGGGTAGYLSYDDFLIDFNHEDVRSIRPVGHGVTS